MDGGAKTGGPIGVSWREGKIYLTQRTGQIAIRDGTTGQLEMMGFAPEKGLAPSVGALPLDGGRAVLPLADGSLLLVPLTR